ncbi:hypothetical protein SNEBB_003611 [Seison nebaliae]|nr:hypothetical protein SNEBB_003611 [Seison nebaliae]
MSNLVDTTSANTLKRRSTTGENDNDLNVSSEKKKNLCDDSNNDKMASEETITENFNIPSNMAGIVIGKGGQTISSIKSETGAKVELQPSTFQSQDRRVTISGTPEQVNNAKTRITALLTDPRPTTSSNSIFTTTLDIPGNKCGLVIGRSGDTIKKLAERFSVKLMIVQENTSCNVMSKPLRISGDRKQVELAEHAVRELISRGNEGSGKGFNPGIPNNNNMNGVKTSILTVPAEKAGMVIGKGGETIREINRKSGAFVEIRKDSQSATEKVFDVRGTIDQIQTAIQLIRNKIWNNGQVSMMNRQEQPFPNAFSNIQQTDAFGNAKDHPPDYSLQWIEYYRAHGEYEKANSVWPNPLGQPQMVVPNASGQGQPPQPQF